MKKMRYDLQFLLDLGTKERILDLCCGRLGEMANELTNSGFEVCVALDQGQQSARIDKLKDKRGIELHVCRFKDCKLSFEDSSFSTVIISKQDLPITLGRSLPAAKKIMREVYRVLQPGGKLVIFGQKVPRPMQIFERIISFPAHPVHLANYDVLLMEGLNFNECKEFRLYPRLKGYVFALPLVSKKVRESALKFLLKNFSSLNGQVKYLSKLIMNIKLGLSSLFYDYYLVIRTVND